jgi:nucleoside-diphosphate-sugar epimerase
MNNTVLVPGGAGFVGSNVVLELLERGFDVIALDDLCTGINNLKGISHPNLRFVIGDIRDIELIDSIMPECDYVINLACRVIAASLADPYGDLEVNAKGTLILLESAKKHGVKSFVYASSASVYGDSGGLKMSETLVPNPSNPYAISKMTGEHYTKFYHSVHGLNTVSLRYFNVYGPRQNPHSVYGGVVPIYCNALKNDEPLRIYGDGEQTRDFTYVKDVARITVDCMLNQDAYGSVFNVGFGEETSINDLVKSFQKIKDTGVKFAENRKIDNVTRRESDCSFIQEKLGYRCEMPLNEGIEITYNWYVKNDTKTNKIIKNEIS